MKGVLELLRRSKPDEPGQPDNQDSLFTTAFADQGADPELLVPWEARANEIGARRLPPGRGLAADGEVLFRLHCQICHGPSGRGASAEELAGSSEPLTSETPDKTIGSYWPYATTLFDFIRRAKPMGAPGSLTNDEVYALSAYLLRLNGVIDAAQEMNAGTLPAVRMPNRDGFIGVDATPRR